MKNHLGDADDASTAPSPKRIKLEHNADEASQLLSGSITTPLTHLKRRGRLPRSTSDERAKALLQDPRISAVEPQQVLCRMCGHWIKLFRHVDYGTANWASHAEKCEVRTKWKARVKREPDCVFTLTIPSLKQVRSPSPTSGPPRITVRLTERKPGSMTNAQPSRSSPPPAAKPTTDTPSNNRGRGKSVHERRLILESDKRISICLAHRVLCGTCDRWVKLHNTREYEIWNWNRHIEKCGIGTNPASSGSSSKVHADLADKSPSDSPGPLTPVETLPSVPDVVDSTAASEADVEEVVGDVDMRESTDDLGGPSTAAGQPDSEIENRSYVRVKSEFEQFELLYPDPEDDTPEESASAAKVRRKNKKGRSLEERKSSLETDPRCSEVRPHEVLCKGCKRWIQLYQNVAYIESNWTRHADRCFGRKESAQAKSGTAGPSTSKSSAKRIAAAAAELPESRLQILRDDERVKTIQTYRVLCGQCDEWVQLRLHRQYDLWNWRAHITTCTQRRSAKEYSSNHYPNADYNGLVIKNEEVGTSLAGPSVPKEPSEPRQPEVAISAPPGLKFGEGKGKDESSPEDRRNILLADDRCKDVEAHRVFCKTCLRHVGLHSRKEYSLANWYKHIVSCNRKAEKKGEGASTPKLPLRTPLTAIGYLRSRGEVEAASPDTDASNLSKEERRTALERDPKCHTVEPHRVLCGMCQQWIKLRDERDYVPFNWYKHKGRCEKKRHDRVPTEKNVPAPQSAPPARPVQAPETPVKEEPVTVSLTTSSRARKSDEQREAELRADPRQAGVEPGRVLCGICKNWIKLNSANGFLPSNWLRHALRCQRKHGWKGGALPVVESPPELQPVEVVDLAQEDNENAVFGFVELESLVNAFEPTVSSTHYGKPWKAPSVETSRKPTPIPYSLPTLRARPSTPSIPSKLRMTTKAPPAPIAVRAPSPVSTPVPAQASKENITGKRMHRSEQSRKEELESDPRTKTVLTDRILCGMCEKWIQMRRDVAYSPQNWLKHAGICEVRSGWLKDRKSTIPTKTELEDAPSEISIVTQIMSLDSKPADDAQDEFKDDIEELPYNARIRMKEDRQVTDEALPQFKPVTWSSDEESDADADDAIEEQHFGEARPIVHQIPVKGGGIIAKSYPFKDTDVAKFILVPSSGTTSSLNSSKSTDSATRDDTHQIPTEIPMKIDTTGADGARNGTTPSFTRKAPVPRIFRPKPPPVMNTSPFTKRPLMRQGLMHHPFGYRPMIGVMHPAVIPAHPHIGRAPSSVDIPRRNSHPSAAPSVITPTPMPYLNILPHLLPKTMVYAYGKMPLPSPFLAPATPPTNSTTKHTSNSTASPSQTTALPTPPATASPKPVPSNIFPAESDASFPSSESRSSDSVRSASDTSKVDQIFVPEQQETPNLPSLSGSYGPVKAGILQLAPVLPAEDRKTLPLSDPVRETPVK